MTTNQTKELQRKRRHVRVRAKVKGTAKRPRLAVYRSNRFIYAQLIDDDAQKTLASVRSGVTIRGIAASEKAGTDLAKVAQEKKITKVVFDRGGFSYLGNIKAFANAARKGGLAF